MLKKVGDRIILLCLSALKYVRGFDKSFPIFLPSRNERDIKYWRMKVLYPLLGIDAQYSWFTHNNKYAIDVVIPTDIKDFSVLTKCVESVRKYVKHRIFHIYIIAPHYEGIKEMVEGIQCDFIDENTIFDDLSKKDIHYDVEGVDRSCWLFQQLIKLQSDTISTHDNYLVVDSDTIFNRPVRFLVGDKTVFNHSDEHHNPYFEVYEKLLRRNVMSQFSFVSHHMMFNKTVLKELKKEIESIHKTEWYRAILENVDYSDKSGFSEYETYGNFYLSRHPDRVKEEYWFNKSIGNFDSLQNVPRYYKTVSLHSYSRI